MDDVAVIYVVPVTLEKVRVVNSVMVVLALGTVMVVSMHSVSVTVHISVMVSVTEAGTVIL